MCRITVGSIVKNLAGHDGERLFLVVAREGDFLYLADGRRRSLSNPKRKNVKHVSATGLVTDIKGISTDRGLRRLIATYPKQTVYKGGCDLG